MTEYVETHLEDDDQASAVLEALAHGRPFVFLVAGNEGGGLGIQCTVGGGIRDADTVRKMLELTMKALP